MADLSLLPTAWLNAPGDERREQDIVIYGVSGMPKDQHADVRQLGDGATWELWFTANAKELSLAPVGTYRTPQLAIANLKPCDCGCDRVAPGGHIEAAHPEDYKYDERA